MVQRSRKNPPKHLEESSEDIDDDTEENIYYPSKRQKLADESWLVKYQPKSSQDVSINPRKLKEVETILKSMIEGGSRCRLLVLSGPAGSSKSTLVKCLAQDLLGSYDANEECYVEYFESSLENISQIHHFQDFMEGCSYRTGKNLGVVLLEELPNVFHEDTLIAFRRTLRSWISTPTHISLPPIVLCITEVEIPNDENNRGHFNIENNFTAETLLGRDLLNFGISQGLIQRVKFLPIAKTYLKKTLSRIISLQKLRGSGNRFEEFLQSLYQSGDVRSSICNLEFWGRSKSWGVIMRESQFTLFHAAGKVIHSSSKLENDPDSEYSNDHELVEHVNDNYHNHGLLQLAILENYHIYNGSQYKLSTAASIVDSLSLNDTMSCIDVSKDYAIRATRCELRSVGEKSSKTLPMKFPRHFKSEKTQRRVRKEILDYVRYIGGMRVSFANVNFLDGYFLPMIYNSEKFKTEHGSRKFIYNRIGGSFKGVYSDEELPVMESEEEVEASAKDQFLEDILEAIRQQEEKVGDDDGESAISSDPIEDSETEGDNFSSQISKRTTAGESDEEDFSDDPELAFLVSQGKL